MKYFLLSVGLLVAGCANQTPAQQAATSVAVATGMLCLADESGKVVATISTNDSNAVKSINAATAVGESLLTDSACQQALVSAAAATAKPAQ